MQLVATVIGSTPFEDLERSEDLDDETMMTPADGRTASTLMASMSAADPALLAATLADIDDDD